MRRTVAGWPDDAVGRRVGGLRVARRPLGLALACSALAYVLAGCGYVVTGLIIGGGDGGGGEAPPKPRVVPISVTPSGGEKTNGLVFVRYRIDDQEGDACDVLVEASVDGGATFADATEYPLPVSEGTANLASTPPGGDPVQHIFVWNSVAQGLGSDVPPKLRMTARDAGGVGPTVDVPTGVDLPSLDNFSLTPQRPIVIGETPTDVAAANVVDNPAAPDLVMDLVATGNESDEVTIFKGAGDGNFTVASRISVAAGPSRILVADVSGDGVRDIVVSNSRAAKVTVILGNGSGGVNDGTFQTPVEYAVGDFPAGIAVGRLLNADATVDIAVVSSDSDAVYILRGTGAGAFATPATAIAVGNQPVGLAAADIDGDGDDDLVTANRMSNDLSMLLQNGSGTNGGGTFAAPVALAAGKGCRAVRVANIDGANKVDLVTVGDGDGNVTALLSNTLTVGTATFGAPLTSVAGQEAFDIALDNMDGDAILDALVTDRETDRLVFLKGNNNGTFQAPVKVRTERGPKGLVIADFNANGQKDVALAGSGLISTVSVISDSVAVHLGDGAGGFTSPPPVVAGGFTFNAFSAGLDPRGLAAADFDLDGTLDFVVANFQNNTAAIVFGDGAGGQRDSGAAQATVLPTGRGPIAVTTARIDGNASQDLIVANFGSTTSFGNTISYFPGPGRNSVPATTITVGNGPAWIEAADFFLGDGKADLAVTNFGANTVTFLQNNGTGTLSVVLSRNVGGAPVECQAGDFNDDGRIDLATANRDGQSVSILLNSASGFGNATNVPVSGNPFALEAADFNADGKLDLAVAAAFGDDVVLLRGNGSGNFTNVGRFPVGDSPLALSALDLNGDGRPDLAAAVLGSDKVALLVNDGGGGFLPGVSLDAPHEPVALVAADFTGDRIPDLAVGSQADDVLLLYAAASAGLADPGILSPPAAFPLGPGLQPVNVAPGDFDSDGALDLMVSKQGNSSQGGQVPGNIARLLAQGGPGAGDGTFGEPATQFVGSDPRRIVARDFDGDGALDILVANAVSLTATLDTFSFVRGRAVNGIGFGAFEAAVNFPTGDGPSGLGVGDFTGDRTPDVAIPHFNEDKVFIFQFIASTRTFSKIGEFAVGRSPVGIVVRDFNGDRKLDLATIDRGADQISILLGDGAGSFSPASPATIAVGINRPNDIAAGDFNADGIPDLTAASDDDGKLAVVLGLGSNGVGNATFAAPVIYENEVQCDELAVADLTGDGVLDIAASTQNSGNVLLFNGLTTGGLPDGTFAWFVQQHTAGVETRGLAATDVNGDGLADVVVSDSPVNEVQVLFGRSAGGQSRMVPLVAFDPVSKKGNVVGAATVPGDANLFGRAAQPARIAVYPYHFEFHEELRGALVSGSPPPVNLVPLTMAFVATGDRMLALERRSDGTSYRVRRRFGPPNAAVGGDRLGLDLAPAAFADQRGIIVDLPIPDARTSVPVTVKVYVREVDWRRSADATQLPRLETVAGSRKFRPVVISSDQVIEVPRAAGDDLATGTGRRFAVDTSDAKNRRIRVLTDKLGVIQAFQAFGTP